MVGGGLRGRCWGVLAQSVPRCKYLLLNSCRHCLRFVLSAVCFLVCVLLSALQSKPPSGAPPRPCVYFAANKKLMCCLCSWLPFFCCAEFFIVSFCWRLKSGNELSLYILGIFYHISLIFFGNALRLNIWLQHMCGWAGKVG